MSLWCSIEDEKKLVLKFWEKGGDEKKMIIGVVTKLKLFCYCIEEVMSLVRNSVHSYAQNFFDPPGHGRIGGHYFHAGCPYVRPSQNKNAMLTWCPENKIFATTKDNDHLLAGAWWVILNSLDLCCLWCLFREQLDIISKRCYLAIKWTENESAIFLFWPRIALVIVYQEKCEWTRES